MWKPIRATLLLLSLSAYNQPSAADYVVNYKAEFTYFLGAFCDGPYPVLQAYCEGGQIKEEGALPGSVMCEVMDVSDLPEGVTSGLNCTTDSCAVAQDPGDCIDPWLTLADLSNGDFGEIHYSCSGETADDVQSYFAFLNTGDGSCDVCTLNYVYCSYLDNFNFHVARLSVLCPPFEGSEDYVNDDAFHECENGFSNPIDHYGGATDELNCISGKNCQFSACEFEFGEDLLVHSNPHEFEHCIQTVSPSASAAVVEEPVVEPAPVPGTYSSSFSASFGFFLVSTFSPWFATSGVCSDDSPTTTIRIVCGNGGAITFLDTSADTVSCQAEGTDTLVCEDSEPLRRGDAIVGPDTSTYYNYFQQIEFECSVRDFYPTASVTYEEETLRCLDFYSNTEARHGLQLGLYCGGRFTGQYSYTDDIAECHDPTNEVLYLDEDGDYLLLGDERRFSCLSEVTLLDYESYDYDFNSGESYSDWHDNRGIDVVVPSLTIESDPRYRFAGTDATECLEFTANSAANLLATDSPTEAPANATLNDLVSGFGSSRHSDPSMRGFP